MTPNCTQGLPPHLSHQLGSLAPILESTFGSGPGSPARAGPDKPCSPPGLADKTQVLGQSHDSETNGRSRLLKYCRDVAHGCPPSPIAAHFLNETKAGKPVDALCLSACRCPARVSQVTPPAQLNPPPLFPDAQRMGAKIPNYGPQVWVLDMMCKNTKLWTPDVGA